MQDVLDRERLSEKDQHSAMDGKLAGMRQSALPHISNEFKGERGTRRSFSADILTKQQAYILGYFIGDGSLGEYSMRAKSQDRDILEYLASCLRAGWYAFPKVLPSKEDGNCWRLCAGSPRLRRFLHLHSGRERRWPEVINWQPLFVIKEFVAGLMDTDGTICLTERSNGYSQYCMAFGSSSLWIKQFSYLLDNIDVVAGKIRKVVDYRYSLPCVGYQMTINTRSYLEAGCFFRAKRKQSLLDAYSRNVKRYRSCK